MSYENITVESITIYGNSEYTAGFSLGINTNNDAEISRAITKCYKSDEVAEAILKSDSGMFSGFLREAHGHPAALCPYSFCLDVYEDSDLSIDKVRKAIIDMLDPSNLVLELLKNGE